MPFDNYLCDYKEKRLQNTVVSVGPRAVKFNIVSNDHGQVPAQVRFFRFLPEIPFSVKFGQKKF